LDDDALRRLYTNPLRVLDSKNPGLHSILEAAPKLIDFLGSESLTRYQAWKQLLDGLGVVYQENHRLVRGLDYYNHAVFEWVTNDLGAQGTVCAGGRYDGLIEQLGGKPTPGIGFGLGIERLLLLLEAHHCLPVAPMPDVYIISLDQSHLAYALSVAQGLRRAGFSVLQQFDITSLKSQMKKADASGAQFAVIIGETERLEQLITLKYLREDRPQMTLPLEEALTRIAANQSGAS
jgi:histidyl-tRNA synthetase